MPITSSAKKALKRDEKRAAHNTTFKENVRYLTKHAQRDITDGKDTAATSIAKAVKALDKAVQNKVLPKNTAARKKARLHAALKRSKTAQKKKSS